MAKLVSIKASAIELLEVLIEETDNKCKSLVQGVAQELSVNNLIATMKTIWVDKRDLYKKLIILVFIDDTL